MQMIILRHSKARAMCEKYEIPIIIPRANKRQVYRLSVDITDLESYYGITILIPFLDAMITEIQNRFSVHRDILSSFSCLVYGSGNINDFDTLIKFYEDDLLENGAFMTTEQVHVEYLLWKRQTSEFPGSKSSVIEKLNRCEKEMFPNIHELLRIVAVILMTTATPERSYSTLRRLKTYLRNTTGEIDLPLWHL
ncbi:hypothetical protein AVEN_228888-1 [Araneus ventricosus]|uniref:HAT C-terminal dimerisation domain-containing protein n=1 Tax=Araneus ventricosus TaxID=182803 RepID=A0A4Y2NY74_ARAVE|nr:hypothetical protein AVEN_228888-1 [Araneus ventricosus]